LENLVFFVVSFSRRCCRFSSSSSSKLFFSASSPLRFRRFADGGDDVEAETFIIKAIESARARLFFRLFLNVCV